MFDRTFVNADAPVTPDCERLFLENLNTIDGITANVARQHHLSPEETEEFAADVHLRFIRDDYRVLRRFRRQCALRTFLTIVIERMCLDFRTAEWGRWRPSARSRRAGATAVLLEQLTIRDGLPFDQACAVLTTNHGVAVDTAALTQLYQAFKPRSRPRFVSDDHIVHEPASHVPADDKVVAAEERALLGRATGALAEALATLAPMDCQILSLHFYECLSVAAIARRLDMKPKGLYRRIERLLQRLRVRLEKANLAATDVLPVLGRSDVEPVGVLRLNRPVPVKIWKDPRVPVLASRPAFVSAR